MESTKRIKIAVIAGALSIICLIVTASLASSFLSSGHLADIGEKVLKGKIEPEVASSVFEEYVDSDGLGRTLSNFGSSLFLGSDSLLRGKSSLGASGFSENKGFDDFNKGFNKNFNKGDISKGSDSFFKSKSLRIDGDDDNRSRLYSDSASGSASVRDRGSSAGFNSDDDDSYNGDLSLFGDFSALLGGDNDFGGDIGALLGGDNDFGALLGGDNDIGALLGGGNNLGSLLGGFRSSGFDSLAGDLLDRDGLADIYKATTNPDIFEVFTAEHYAAYVLGILSVLFVLIAMWQAGVVATERCKSKMLIKWNSGSVALIFVAATSISVIVVWLVKAPIIVGGVVAVVALVGALVSLKKGDSNKGKAETAK